MPDGVAYVDYVKQYEHLPDTFNPFRFDPAAWADIAREAFQAVAEAMIVGEHRLRQPRQQHRLSP